MKTKIITLISYGHFEKEFLQEIAESIEYEFNFPVKLLQRHIDLSTFYDPERKQYDGNALLMKIDSKFSSNSYKTVGLFRVDLYIPILTYIYGQAYLNGQTAIASLFRLKNERYGMEVDEQLLLERFKKEVIHELGHTFGLRHCYLPTCVMVSSTYVEDIDQKEASMCMKCRSTFEELNSLK
ncbi:MAG: archaemetzincin family Zn-dependent metalloprotease [Bacteroidales bacterium]|nr:archaemetzincin family Zn-dependent metalloprotease [Bacteroidales bacterium]MCB9013533.1 archaemetzincin family Zn-dependent metalloprotease [Bacteroidales bacterium]